MTALKSVEPWKGHGGRNFTRKNNKIFTFLSTYVKVLRSCKNVLCSLACTRMQNVFWVAKMFMKERKGFAREHKAGVKSTGKWVLRSLSLLIFFLPSLSVPGLSKFQYDMY